VELGYTDFLDRGFPFLEATLDCRGLAPAGTRDNLTPRGIIMPLGEQVYVCFDTELLRVAAIWQGDFVTPHGMAMFSYNEPLREISSGQNKLSKPRGKIWAATGLYPGWSRIDNPITSDPRPRGEDERELGRGPLSNEAGRWLGVVDAGDTAILRYRVHGAEVSEHFTLERDVNGLYVARRLEVSHAVHPLRMVVNDFGDSPVVAGQQSSPSATLAQEEGRLVQRVEPRNGIQSLEIHYRLSDRPASPGPETRSATVARPLPQKQGQRWTATVTVPVIAGAAQGAYAVDEIALPYPNPWCRRIRPIDLAFQPDGTAVVLTFDGDVYVVSGLTDDAMIARWTRIAAGFNEPQSVQLREGDIFVFSRLGVTKLVDRDGDGETDAYEMFCNAFTQSAETRDYPLSLVLLPDRSFLISKGGQGGWRPHRGRVLRISADGERVSPFASGLRNAYLGVDPTNGLITASDQQGNWVPSSPLFKLRKGSYHGFSPGAHAAAAEIDPPLIWMPHRIAQSTVGQVRGFDRRSGPLDGATLLIDFQRPGLLKILLPAGADPVQAAAASLPVTLPIPAIKGDVNPADGLPYFAGFRIEGSRATKVEGLCRLRPVEQTDGLPVHAEVFRYGILLEFPEPLDEKLARDPANYGVSSWEYRRTSAYGSGQYRADGEAGADRWHVHSAWPSADGHSVFIAIDGLRPTMQLELTHRLFGEWSAIYFTVNALPEFSSGEAEFAQLGLPAKFEASPPQEVAIERMSEATSAQGERVAVQMGCLGCHSTDGTNEGRAGPTLRGLIGSPRQLGDGREVIADEAYLRRSVLDPSADIVSGYQGKEIAMPSYQGIVSDRELRSLLMYLETLR